MDERGWDCFFQLSAGLRRAGFRTVRVTTTPYRRVAGQLCFDRTVGLSSPEELDGLAEIVDGEQVVDVQVVDALSVPTARGLARLVGNPALADWQARAATVDKPWVAERLQEAGLSVPAEINGDVAGADQVIETLGLPVVHKVRTGSGGEGVVIVTSRDQLEQILVRGRHTGSTFFEQFIDGRHLQFAGVTMEGREGLFVTYETLARKGHMGPASELRCVDDPRIDAAGRDAVAALGIRGPVNINFIRDAEGVDWLHDVNPRLWGSVVSFRAVGLDFLAAYIAYLRGARRFDAPWGAPSTQRIQAFPAAFQIPLEGASPLADQWRFVRGAWPYLRWAGPRYVVHTFGHRLTNRDPTPVAAPAAPWPA